MPQIVYVLTNEAMPGIVKIGMTEADTVEARMAQLNAHSGVPLPFECYFAAEVQACRRIESILHQLFSEQRINPRREFFHVDPEKVVLAISIGSFSTNKFPIASLLGECGQHVVYGLHRLTNCQDLSWFFIHLC